ncbi:uncharacterized protein EV154DRAFT_429642, partial [Mucor mucedo]|uniref:uncharacterized protein n=1 Tax=Mucor mucedo TaxID=29922 RepID=UPI00221F66BA
KLKMRSLVNKVYVSVNCDSKESITNRDSKNSSSEPELKGLDENIQGNYIIVDAYFLNES